MIPPVCIPLASAVPHYLSAESGPGCVWVGSGKGNGNSPMALRRGSVWDREEQEASDVQVRRLG